MRINLKKTEIILILLSILIISFVFGFDDGRKVFEWSFWIANFFKIAIIVTISLLIHILAHKFAARYHKCSAEYKLWGIKRYWFAESAKLKTELPLGILLPLFAVLISFTASNGSYIFPFIAIETFIVSDTIGRLGRKYINLTEFEEAKIALAGPLASISLAFLFKFLASFNPGFNAFVTINSLMAFYHMLPLPKLDGIKILFGSRTFYIFAFIFIAASALLLQYTGTLTTIILALLLAVILAVSYHYSFRT